MLTGKLCFNETSIDYQVGIPKKIREVRQI